MIFLEPSGGLCNRMRAIVGGIELAEKKNTKLIILWKRKAELNASFKKLFKPIEGVKVIDYRTSKDFREIICKHLAKSRINDEQIRLSKRDSGSEIEENFVNEMKLPAYIWTCEQCYADNRWFSLFKPQEIIEKRILEIKKKFSTSMVGVHIRRTDSVDSICYSKIENFIDLMNKEVEKDSQICFYLATDDKNEEDYLREVFGNRIISNEKRVLERDSLEGMYDAVCDLYCLASCKKIIGSYWSSFTDTAAIIGNCEKKIAGIDG